jgi:cytochrome c oxidase assembly protein subunit 15
MNGHLVPPEILALEPWWKNFFYNMATVQFVHRAIAWLLIVLVPVFWWRAVAATHEPRRRLACHLLLAALVLQVSLGIATLLLAVPTPLGAAHQAGAVLLLAVSLWAAHEFGAPANTTVRSGVSSSAARALGAKASRSAVKSGDSHA